MDKIAPFHRNFKETKDIKDWERMLRREALDVEKVPEKCPFCGGGSVVRKGVREKKLEVVQRYLCGSCRKTFTSQKVKGKQFPLRLIIDGLSYYNLGHRREEVCRLLKEGYGLDVAPRPCLTGLRNSVPCAGIPV